MRGRDRHDADAIGIDLRTSGKPFVSRRGIDLGVMTQIKVTKPNALAIARAVHDQTGDAARGCKMVAIPTTKDEDAKRPNREHESLVGEQSRIVNLLLR